MKELVLINGDARGENITALSSFPFLFCFWVALFFSYVDKDWGGMRDEEMEEAELEEQDALARQKELDRFVNYYIFLNVLFLEPPKSIILMMRKLLRLKLTRK